MKRRVAGLPPVSANVFNQKVLERRADTAVMLSPKGSTCEVCKSVLDSPNHCLLVFELVINSKIYTTEGAYRSHVISKKHKENELKAALNPKPQPEVAAEVVGEVSSFSPSDSASLRETPGSVSTLESKVASLEVDENENQDKDEDEDDEVNQTIDQKIAAARARLSPSHCLFCPDESTSLEENLTHMSTVHSFFIPDADYLIDIPGLISYLGEKIAVGNVCIYCNGKGKEFRTLEAVRKHMVDKSHCKIAYESGDDRLEISDYYDFTSSYPDVQLKKKNKPRAVKEKATGEWEDLEGDDGEEVDEIVDEESSGEDSDGDSDGLPDNEITYGDSDFELVLASGARIGHRSLRRYYVQSFPGAPRSGKPEDPNSGAALVRRLLADKNSALVPRKGGFGAFGSGTEVVKARNRGEALEAGRHVREFRDQKRREDFKTRIGFINNAQKHFRDPRKHYSPFTVVSTHRLFFSRAVLQVSLSLGLVFQHGDLSIFLSDRARPFAIRDIVLCLSAQTSMYQLQRRIYRNKHVMNSHFGPVFGMVHKYDGRHDQHMKDRSSSNKKEYYVADIVDGW